MQKHLLHHLQTTHGQGFLIQPQPTYMPIASLSIHLPPLPSLLSTLCKNYVAPSQQVEVPEEFAFSPQTPYQNLDFTPETKAEFAQLHSHTVSNKLLDMSGMPSSNLEIMAIRSCTYDPQVCIFSFTFSTCIYAFSKISPDEESLSASLIPSMAQPMLQQKSMPSLVGIEGFRPRFNAAKMHGQLDFSGQFLEKE